MTVEDVLVIFFSMSPFLVLFLLWGLDMRRHHHGQMRPKIYTGR